MKVDPGPTYTQAASGAIIRSCSTLGHTGWLIHALIFIVAESEFPPRPVHKFAATTGTQRSGAESATRASNQWDHYPISDDDNADDG